MEFADPVERAFGVLLEDAERLGPLSREHIVNVASRRSLDAAQTAELFRLLTQADEVLDAGVEVADGRENSVRIDSESLIRRYDEMPGKLLDHRVLRAEQEVVLGRQIQLGLQAQEELDRGETSVELVALAMAGDAARRTMIRNNIRLARDIAAKFLHVSGDLELDDLTQEGIAGLNRAAEKFNPELGFKFSTYATWWVKQVISRAIDDTGTIVRLPVHVRDELRQIIRYRSSFEERNNRFPSLEETAEGVGKAPGHVQAILDFAAPVIRLDAPIGEDENGETLTAVLLPPGPSVEDEVIDRAAIRAIEKRLEELTSGYDPRFVRILEGRFGLHGHDEMTLDALGSEFGITRERIRQLEKKIRLIIQADPVLESLRFDYWKETNGAA